MADQVYDAQSHSMIGNSGQVGSGADYRKKFRKQGLAEPTAEYNKAKSQYEAQTAADEAKSQKKALSSMGSTSGS